MEMDTTCSWTPFHQITWINNKIQITGFQFHLSNQSSFNYFLAYHSPSLHTSSHPNQIRVCSSKMTSPTRNKSHKIEIENFNSIPVVPCVSPIMNLVGGKPAFRPPHQQIAKECEYR